MLVRLEFADNGVIVKRTLPASEGTLEEVQTLLFTDQAKFLKWVELCWAESDAVAT